MSAKKKFLVRIDVTYSEVVEARTLEEAEEIAANLDCDKMDQAWGKPEVEEA